MNAFQSNIISIYREKGAVWFDELHRLARSLYLKLGLRDLQEVTNLTYNYVLSGFQGDKPIILKLGFDNEGLKREAFALKCFTDCGAVKMLVEDKSMLLLERAVPRTSLKSYFPKQELASIEIACELVKKLHQARIPERHNSLTARVLLIIMNLGFQIIAICLMMPWFYGLRRN